MNSFTLGFSTKQEHGITNLSLKSVKPHFWAFVINTVVHFMFPHQLTPGQAVETEEI
jgi:hypothetical protein